MKASRRSMQLTASGMHRGLLTQRTSHPQPLSLQIYKDIGLHQHVQHISHHDDRASMYSSASGKSFAKRFLLPLLPRDMQHLPAPHPYDCTCNRFCGCDSPGREATPSGTQRKEPRCPQSVTQPSPPLTKLTSLCMSGVGQTNVTNITDKNDNNRYSNMEFTLPHRPSPTHKRTPRHLKPGNPPPYVHTFCTFNKLQNQKASTDGACDEH